MIARLKPRKIMYSFSYLGEELDLFRDREDPVQVYVILKNKLTDNLLKDFSLQNAIALAARLYRALPDRFINARHYVEEIRKTLASKVGDHHFTRKMGLNITSMLLGVAHQRKFDAMMARLDDNPILKEPFDRETKGKMATFQRQHLDGPEKYGSLGALSKKSTEMIAMMASNKIPVPPKKSDLRRERRKSVKKESKSDKKKDRKRRSIKRSRRDVEVVGEVEQKKPKVEKGEKVKISKVSKQDLQRIVALSTVGDATGNLKLKIYYFRPMVKLEDYKSEIVNFFETCPVNKQNVIMLAKSLFEQDSFKAGKLLSTKRFKLIVHLLIKFLNILDPLRSQIKHSLYDSIQSYRTKNGSRVNHAPLKCPIKLRQTMFNLYYSKRVEKKFSKPFTHDRLLRNKISALHALCDFVTGRRWVDITRIRWDNMKVLRTSGKISLKFFIACSKANQGTRNEGVTLMEDGSDLCPVKLMTEFWINSGRPKVGFVFNCLHKKAKFPEFELCDQWLSRRCPGHKMGAKTFTCNGEVNGDVTYGVFRREARRLGFEGLPSKNTFRRLGCVMSHKLDLTREQITATLGWKWDSDMVIHYLQNETSTDRSGLAFKLSEKIRNNDFEFMNDIPMDN